VGKEECVGLLVRVADELAGAVAAADALATWDVKGAIRMQAEAGEQQQQQQQQQERLVYTAAVALPRGARVHYKYAKLRAARCPICSRMLTYADVC
jgi:hypothetical protein